MGIRCDAYGETRIFISTRSRGKNCVFKQVNGYKLEPSEPSGFAAKWHHEITNPCPNPNSSPLKAKILSPKPYLGRPPLPPPRSLILKGNLPPLVKKLQGQQIDIVFNLSFFQRHEWKCPHGITDWYLTTTTTSTSSVPRSLTSALISTTPSKNTSSGSTSPWWIQSTIKDSKAGGLSSADSHLPSFRLFHCFPSKATSTVSYKSSKASLTNQRNPCPNPNSSPLKAKILYPKPYLGRPPLPPPRSLILKGNLPPLVKKLQGQQIDIVFNLSFFQRHEWKCPHGITDWYLTTTTTSTSSVPRSSTSALISTTPSKNTSSGSTSPWWIQSTIKDSKAGGLSSADSHLPSFRLFHCFPSKATSTVSYKSSKASLTNQRDPLRGGRDELLEDIVSFIHAGDAASLAKNAVAPPARRLVPELMLQLARKIFYKTM
ncbi:hypothetical protein IEQ34_022659 [Dendrobium chrysotoxum]|uniref:Uncharacterized protein n=1 Tax=Dendrobium chrysotoxum TaxID=161865 RepID=A0AAV7FK85_DENCH|nr:hypothetical protein IEQ34_022659 [Dendrobium chrysotoxum]